MEHADCTAGFTAEMSAKPPPIRPIKIGRLAISPSASRKTTIGDARCPAPPRIGALSERPVHSDRRWMPVAFAAEAPKRPNRESAADYRSHLWVRDPPSDAMAQTARPADP